MTSPVYIAAARRTPIAPKNGVLKERSFHELAVHTIRPLIADLPPEASILSLIGGNALGAGGNPARLMALASGLPEHIPASTVDTQCCSGLDAIGYGFYRLRGSAAGPSPAFVLAGGAESASQAPIRHNRLTNAAYDEAPFTPWPDRNPSMIQAAHRLEEKRPIELSAAYDWAIQSHQGNLANQSAASSLTSIPGGPCFDSLPRQLTAQLCVRAQDMGPYNSTLMAPMADGAAFVALTTTAETPDPLRPLEVLDYYQVGADPEYPGLGTAFLDKWLSDSEKRFQFDRAELLVSLMESFAAQVLVNIQDLKLNSNLVNPWGGLLARGHPIGASGAVLVCDLFDHLQVGQFGLAAIPAAGGLVSGLLVRRVGRLAA